MNVAPTPIFDTIADIEQTNPLAQHYRRFDVANRLLFTGHSHQAWPDCAREGLIRAYDEASTRVDKKWGNVREVNERLTSYLQSLMNFKEGEIVLGQNAHELVVRFLSGLPLRSRPRIVTTDEEFFSPTTPIRSTC